MESCDWPVQKAKMRSSAWEPLDMIIFRVLLLLFSSASCFAFHFPPELFDGLSLQERADVEAVPADLGANQFNWRQYCSGYNILMNWAVNRLDSLFIDRLVHGAHPDLISTVLKGYARGGSYEKLRTVLPHINLGLKVWLKSVRFAAIRAGTSEEQKFISTIDLLLNHDPALTAANINVLDDIFSAALASSLSHFLLDYLMGNPLFPARRLGRLTEGWSSVICGAIGQDRFIFLRKLLADWDAFKKNVDLSFVRFVLPAGAQIPASSRAQFYIVLAFEADSGLDVLWLLAGRTTIFRTFQDPAFRAGHYGQRLLEMIPELGIIDWNTNESLTDRMAKFIQSVHEKQPENVSAQTTALLSSTWRMPIEEYIKAALATCSLTKFRATMRAGKLCLHHLPMIHMSPCPDISDLDQAIDEYFGVFDHQSLWYKNEGPVFVYAHILLGRVWWRARERILALVSSWYRMGNMAVLRALDQIIASLHSDNEMLRNLPDAIRAFALQDPATILDIRVAWTLLTFYMANGQVDLLKETINHLPLVTKCSCALASRTLLDDAPFLQELLLESIEDDPRLFEFLHQEATIRGGTIIPPFVLTLLSEETLHELLLASSNCTRPTLTSMVLTQLGDDLSELAWIDALCRASPASFQVLFDWPIAERLDWLHNHLYRIETEILVPALLNEQGDLVSKLLSTKAMPRMAEDLQRGLLALAAERKWKTLGLFFDLMDIGRPLYMTPFYGKSLVKSLLEARKKRLVARLLQIKSFFGMVLRQPPANHWILLEMFPQLIGATDVDEAYRKFALVT